MGSSPDWVKDYKIGIYCFIAKHTAVKSKSWDLLARNHDNVSERGDMSTCTSIMLVQWATCTSIMLVQWTNTINIQISLLVYYKVNIIISLNVACSCNDIHVAENCSFWHQATIIHTTLFQLHLCGQHIIPLYPVYQCSSIDVHNLFFSDKLLYHRC